MIYCEIYGFMKNKTSVGLHKLEFFVNEISCTQNRFRWTSEHVGNSAHKKADVHVTNNN